MRRLLVCGALLSGLATGALSGQAKAPGCDRACLIQFVDRYLSAMLAHDASRAPFAGSIRFTENTVALPLTEGLWFTSSGLGEYRLYVADAPQGQVGFVGEVLERGRTIMLALRLKIDGQRITEAQTIVSRSMPIRKTLRPVFTERLTLSGRRSRSAMTQAANSYFEGIEQITAKVVAFHPECQRLAPRRDATSAVAPGEPRQSNFRMQPCAAGFDAGDNADITSVTPRQTNVIDEEYGLTLGFYSFHHRGVTEVRLKDGTVRQVGNGEPWTTAMAEVFKIKDGMILDIEAVGNKVPYGMGTGWR